jgi:hypothetical protein
LIKQTRTNILNKRIDPRLVKTTLRNKLSPSPNWENTFGAQFQMYNRFLTCCYLDRQVDKDQGEESPYKVLLRQTLPTIIGLVAYLFLQLWIDEQGLTDTNWPEIFAYAFTLVILEEKNLTDPKKFRLRPDFIINGLDPEFLVNTVAPWTKLNRSKIIISTIDAKNTSNSGKSYEPEDIYQAPAHSMTKDTYISTLLQTGELVNFNNLVSKDSWKGQTHTLLAQVILYFSLFSTY